MARSSTTPSRYIAFLRAINVGGRFVKMQDLKKAFEGLPVRNVETFIASGNVIFDASVKDPATLERKAEVCLKKAFGFEVDTFVRSLEELQQIAECQPYSEVASTGKGGTVYIGFLREAPDRKSHEKIRAVCTDVDEFCISSREVLWLHRDTAEEGLSGGPPLEKLLGLRATFRNARTVKRIAAKYA